MITPELFQAHPYLSLGIAFLISLGVIAWGCAGMLALKYGPLDEDVPPPSSAGLRPEEAERPGIAPHKLDVVTLDRPFPFAFTLSVVYETPAPVLDPDIDALCKEIEGRA